MIRLTVARYYTPSGRCIQKPYEKEGGNSDNTGYANDLNQRFRHGEMMHADSIRFPDSLKYHTQTMHRTVYGGGGIMPDYFVPLDTTRYTAYHAALAARGIILKNSTKYVEQNRKKLKATYRTFETFLTGFDIDEAQLSDLRRAADDEKIPYDETQYQKSLPLIKNQLKALIARDLWEMNEYYRVINSTNETVQQALRLLNEHRYETILTDQTASGSGND
jgi:carboxyl-terminal processing protease